MPGDEKDTPGFEHALGLVGSGASARAAATVVTAGASFATTVLLVRLLGTVPFGALALGLAIVGLATAITKAGFGIAATRTLAAYLATGERNKAEEVVQGLNTIVVVGGAIGLGLVVSVVAVTQVQLDATQKLAVGFGLGVLLIGRNAAAAAGAVARGLGRVVMMEVPPLVGILAQLVVAIVLVVLGLASVGAVAVGFGMAGLVAVIASVAALRRMMPEPGRAFHPSFTAARGLLRITAPYAVAGVAVRLIASFDVLVLGVTHPGRPVGSYAPVATLLQTLVMLAPVLLTAMFVTAATRLFAARDSASFGKLYLTVSKVSVLIAMPAFCLLATAPVQTFQFVYGDTFPVSAAVVWVLLIGFFVSVSFGVNAQALIASGERWRLARAFLLPAIVMVASSLILIPPFGVLGAATATSFSTVVFNISMSWTLFRATGVHPFHRGLVLVVATAPFAIITARQLHETFGGGLWAAVLLSSAVWALWILLARLLGAFRFAELRGFVPRRNRFATTGEARADDG